MSYDNRRCAANVRGTSVMSYGVHGTVGTRHWFGNRQTAVCDNCKLPIYAIEPIDDQWRAEYSWIIHEEEELADAL